MLQEANRQPEVGSFLADLSPAMGYDNSVVHQGDGPDQHSPPRSRWPTFEEAPKVDEETDKPAPKKKAKVPKETKARPRDEVIDDGQDCMLCGDLCSGVRPCQAPADLALPSVAKTSGAPGPSAKSYWNSLQTFSFARWCSRLLGDVLASFRHPFCCLRQVYPSHIQEW